MEPRLDLPVQLVRRELTNSSTGADRGLIRRVRDLVAERFDVDALPPRTPVEVWTQRDQLVAFSVHRPEELGGRFSAMLAATDGELLWLSEQGGTLSSPLTSRPLMYHAISSNIGMREHPLRKRPKFHAGTDLAAPIGTPVVAIAEGVVKRAASNWTAGRYVVVQHDTGHETRYLHLHGRPKSIVPGVRVKKGDVLGLVGKSGRVTGPHLHFEIRDRWGTPLDAAKVSWPADGALTDHKALLTMAERWALLRAATAPGAPTVSSLLLDRPAGMRPAPLPPEIAAQQVPPAVPARHDRARARFTPPLIRRRKTRRTGPPAIGLFDSVTTADLIDPLVQRALELADTFAFER
jgi:murein DD-endopeptidase MepM/ murein hydrolase activator NlpD